MVPASESLGKSPPATWDGFELQAKSRELIWEAVARSSIILRLTTVEGDASDGWSMDNKQVLVKIFVGIFIGLIAISMLLYLVPQGNNTTDAESNDTVAKSATRPSRWPKYASN